MKGGFDRDVRSGCGRDGLCDEPLGGIQLHHRQPIRQVTELNQKVFQYILFSSLIFYFILHIYTLQFWR